MTGSDPRRAVPRTDAVLADPRLADAAAELGRRRVKAAVTHALEQVRRGDLDVVDPGATSSSATVVADAALAVLPAAASSLRPVVNATGVVLHTNLGRAALSAAAVHAVRDASAYVDVEFDLDSGHRARRGRDTLAALHRAVPAAEDVHVVNNGAAALLLATHALAAGREVIVSRGEMVEIGDGFRLPALVESGGVRLREVGTTNRVTLDDYRAAIGPDTGAILKVHPSNFVVSGFTGVVPTAALATLDVPVIADIGSGLLAPDALLPDEPDADTALRAGAAVVTCSGDKLLGGPQAGLLLGRGDAVARMRRAPLARALRVDKLTLAALEATLDGPPTPTSTYLHADAGELHARCEAIAAHLDGVNVVASEGVVGGGGAPGVTLPGWALAAPAAVAVRLRAGDPPVVGRVEAGRCVLDLRCVDPADDPVLASALERALRAETD